MGDHKQKEAILRILRDNNITSLWHFTDIRNLYYIKKLGGLLSKNELEKKNLLSSIYSGGNSLSKDLDKFLNNWDKISLSFTPHTPIFYKKSKQHKKEQEEEQRHFVFIEISPEVATFDNVYFTDCNATRLRDGQKRDQGVKGLENVRFEYINCLPNYDDENWIKYVQAEILVPNYIPIKYFKKIHFVSKASFELGMYYWGNNSKLFTVNPNTFSYYDNSLKKWGIKFPYLEKVTFTHQTVDKNNYQRNFHNLKTIHRGKNFHIISFIYSLKDTQGKILLKKSEEYTFKEEKINFNEESFWYWYPNFLIYPYYSSKDFIIEIYLNDILWYKTKKEVI